MSQDEPTRLDLELTRIRRGMVGVMLALELVLAFLHMRVAWASDRFPKRVVRLFHLDREGNLPTWFSSSQLTLLGLAFASVFVLDRRLRPERRTSALWLASSLCCFFLSADEASEIHELLGTLFGEWARSAAPGSLARSLSKYPSYYWALLYAPIAIPLALLAGRFAWRELGRERWLFLVGLGCFFAGALGVDYLEGSFGTHDHRRLALTTFGAAWELDVFLVEELLEMLGVTFLLAAVTQHASKLALRLEAQRAHPTLETAVQTLGDLLGGSGDRSTAGAGSIPPEPGSAVEPSPSSTRPNPL